MSMSKMGEIGTDILLIVFVIYLFFYYFDIFLARKRKRLSTVSGITMLVAWQWGSRIFSEVFPAFINVIITASFVLISIVILYEGKFWNKCVFSFEFSAIWMMMETLSGYILLIYCNKFANLKLISVVGAFTSKILFYIVIAGLKKVFTDDEIKELPIKYSIMLAIIPIGSIYIMNDIFMLSYSINNRQTNLRSAITAVILLCLNVLIFYIYIKLADILQLRRMTSVYEQQLDLCERHQQEREVSMLQLRDAKHNMKNHLVSILAYAQVGECDKVISFVNDLMEDGGLRISAIANSGNVVIDSLVGYWYALAEKSDIDFTVDLNIPMQMMFKGSDISLILGNLLENAVEATQKVPKDRYIRVQVKYDKNNLLLYVVNNYYEQLRKTKNNVLKSTKQDAANHGVGIQSVYRIAEKYHGTVIIDDSIVGRFSVKVVLYGK